MVRVNDRNRNPDFGDGETGLTREALDSSASFLAFLRSGPAFRFSANHFSGRLGGVALICSAVSEESLPVDGLGGGGGPSGTSAGTPFFFPDGTFHIP
jgi:hypothetical protein